MDKKQLTRLCIAIKKIAEATKECVQISKEIMDTDQYTAQRIAGPASVIAGSNVLLSEVAQEILPEDITPANGYGGLAE